MTGQEKAAYWQSLSDEWLVSGESQKKFCARKGINYSQFITWRSKILVSEAKSRNQLEPVKVTSDNLSHRQSAFSAMPQVAGGIYLSLPNGIKVSIATATPMKTIQDVLTCLGVMPC